MKTSIHFVKPDNWWHLWESLHNFRRVLNQEFGRNALEHHDSSGSTAKSVSNTSYLVQDKHDKDQLRDFLAAEFRRVVPSVVVTESNPDQGYDQTLYVIR